MGGKRNKHDKITKTEIQKSMSGAHISYDDFAKIDLRIGTVKSAERVEGSSKLLKLSVDIGEETPRQILAGIGKAYTPEEMVDTQIVVIANLTPRILMGLESQGMLLAAGDGLPVLLRPAQKVQSGSAIH